uniref:Uncharacterized protein n=1 Tax=Scleropages formosus TaxID=113540 RepID=A0A8D0CL07_SCLFO
MCVPFGLPPSTAVSVSERTISAYLTPSGRECCFRIKFSVG